MPPVCAGAVWEFLCSPVEPRGAREAGSPAHEVLRHLNGGAPSSQRASDLQGMQRLTPSAAQEPSGNPFTAQAGQEAPKKLAHQRTRSSVSWLEGPSAASPLGPGQESEARHRRGPSLLGPSYAAAPSEARQQQLSEVLCWLRCWLADACMRAEQLLCL